MDSALVKSRSLIGLFFILFCFSLNASSEGLSHMAYIEKRGGEIRIVEARIQGEEIFIDQQTGSFVKNIRSWPFVLQSLSPLEKSVVFSIENFPALLLQRKFQLIREEKILGRALAHYQIFLETQAKEEAIPLSEEEAKMNLLLRPFEIEKVDLKGEGDCWVDLESQKIVTEQFTLKGVVIRRQIEEGWRIEYAKGLERL